MGNYFRDLRLDRPTKNGFASFLFAFGLTLLFLLSVNVFITSILFLAGGHLTMVVPEISIGLTVIFALVAGRILFKRYYILVMVAVLAAVAALIVVSVLIEKNIYDVSYDGQTYQQEAVIRLAQGWDPVYTYLSPGVIGGEQKWINYYPKSAWINESSIYLLTGEIQTGKALNIILVVMAAALVYAALIDAGLMGSLGALVVSILVAVNPINLYQWAGYYVDGQLFSLFIALIAICMIIHSKKRDLGLLALFLVLPIFLNIKFTSVVDAGIILIIFWIAMVRHEDTELARKSVMVSIVAGVLGMLIVGASPYVTNLARYKTPFYPLQGAGAIDLKPFNVPGTFIDKNSLEIFFLSIFSRSDGVRGVGTTNQYKIPFTYTPKELAVFDYPDPEEGGFGPLFGGVLIVGLAIMLGYYLFRSGAPPERRYDSYFWIGMLVMILLLGISIINPISSLARYVPQGYLIALIPIIVLLATRRPVAVLVASVAIALVFFNNYLIFQNNLAFNLKDSAAIAAELSTLAARSRTAPIKIYFNEFRSNRIMFDEAGIRYTGLDDSSQCVNPKELLPENTTEFCS